MYILPLKLLTHSDRNFVGDELISLSILQRKGFPIADTHILFPPDQIHSSLSVLNGHQLRKKLEQKLNWEVLKKINSNLKFEVIQKDIIGSWINQHSAKFSSLKPIAIISAPEARNYGQGYLNPVEGLIITQEKNKLSPDLYLELDGLIKSANNHLLLSYLYHWIYDGQGFKFLRLQPLTQNFHDISSESGKQSLIGSLEKTEKDYQISTTKVISKGFEYNIKTDGCFLEIDGLTGEIIDKVVLLAKEFGNKPVYVKLGNLSAENIKSFLSLRNKFRCYNVQAVIGSQQSPQKYLELKRDFASYGLYPKVSFGIYLELSTPENFINLNRYIEVGLSGAIINVEALSINLGGTDQGLFEPQTLISFLTDSVKLLNKNQIPFLVIGKTLLDDEVLKFMVKNGVYGVIVESIKLSGLKEHLNLLEKINLGSFELD